MSGVTGSGQGKSSSEKLLCKLLLKIKVALGKPSVFVMIPVVNVEGKPGVALEIIAAFRSDSGHHTSSTQVRVRDFSFHNTLVSANEADKF